MCILSTVDLINFIQFDFGELSAIVLIEISYLISDVVLEINTLLCFILCKLVYCCMYMTDMFLFVGFC